MKRWITPIATLAGVTVMVACASAQQSTAPAQPDSSQSTDKKAQKPAVDKKKGAAEQAKQGQGKQADKKQDAKSETTDEEEPKPKVNNVTLGYTTWNSSGNRNAMSQNGLVQGGFGLADLSILVPFNHNQFSSGQMAGNPGDDFGLRLKTEWGGGTNFLVNAHQFTILDPSFGAVDPSRNKSWDATLEQQLAPNVGAFATAKYVQDEYRYPAPLPQTDYVNKSIAVGAQGQMGNHTLGAIFTENSFSDLSGTQPSTLTDRGELQYTGSWGPRLTAMGSVFVARVQQQGTRDNFIRGYNVSGVYEVNEDSSLGAHVGDTALDLYSVQNTFVRRKLDAGATYHTHFGEWNLGLGYGHREEERVRADHSYTDVPQWNSYDFKANGRLTKTIRLGFKGSIDDLANQPVFQTDDPTLLYWSRKSNLEGKVSSGDETTSGYASYSIRHRENSQRQFKMDWYSAAVGASRVFSPKLLAYGEFASEQYTTSGVSPVASPLGAYLAPSETFSLGLDYTRNAREALSFVVTSFYTQDQWGQQVAMTYRLDLGKERNFQITYSPWLQRDRLYDVDTFTAPILTMRLGFRF